MNYVLLVFLFVYQIIYSLLVIGINKGENNHGIFLGNISEELENNDIQSSSENESLNEDNENNSSIAILLII